MERPRPDPEALLAHEAFLRAIARPLVRDENGVDDVIQETWLTALRKQPRDASRLRQWLGTVARNLALHARRADERRARREQAVAKREDDDVVARVARHQKIVDAVLGLDEPYRTAVLLRFYDGLSSDAIGARSGVSGAAVRKRLAKALDLLRVRLDDVHGGDRRAWSAVLLPFVAVPRLEPAALLGGLVVGTKTKLVLAAVLLSFLLGTYWVATRPSESPARTGSARVPTLSSEPVPSDIIASEALPPPVDFSLIDRDRDLHGVVVRRDGTPVAGAVVRALYPPLLRTYDLSYESRFEERDGPEATSASDGTFAIRLAWGDAVRLRATARGLATRDTALAQAGERVRIVMVPPVLLGVLVRDDGGAAVPGCRVELFLGGAGFGSVQRERVTRGDGRCVFEDLPDDVPASLTATHAKLATAHRKVDLESEREIEITLEAGLTVRGRVLDATTLEPIPGALVDLFPAGLKATRTDADGHYALAGVPRVGPMIGATADGYCGSAIQIYRFDPICYQDIRLHPNYEPQRHEENGEEVDLLLPRAEVVTGRVVGQDGAPVAGATVAAGWPSLLPACGESGADGRFRLAGPWNRRAPGGKHQLVAMATGRGRAIVPFDAEHLDIGDIVLAAPGAIEGRVLTPQGDPVPRTAVLLQGGLKESRPTDDLGRFRFPDLEPGLYMLSVEPEGAPALIANVEVPAGGHVLADLCFEKWAVFRVRVENDGGTPIAGTKVFVSTGFRSSETLTDDQGRATVNVVGSPRLVGVEPPPSKGPVRYRSAPMREIERGEWEATFVLVAEGVARGRVEDPRGAPVPMAELRVRQGGMLGNGVGTSPDGTFEVQVPRDSEFDLVLTGLSFDPRPPKELRLLRGELTGLRAGAEGLVLKASAVDAPRTLRVRLQTPDGKSVDGSVSALPSAYPFVVDTSQGVAELKGLPDEEVEIKVTSLHWFWLSPHPVRVLPAGQEVTLRFREAGIVGGQVLFPDGKPAEGATVEVLRGDAQIASCSAGPNGRFGLALEPDIEGPLRLRARSDPLTDTEYEAVVDGVTPGSAGRGYSSTELKLAPVR